MNATDLPRLARVRALARSGEARRIREAAGLSLAEIAAPVGVAVTTVWRWEHGQRAPHGEAALRYERVLSDLDAATGGGRAA